MRFSTLSGPQFSYCCSGLRRLNLGGKLETGCGEVDDDDDGAAFAFIFIVSPLCHRSRHFYAACFCGGVGVYYHPPRMRPFSPRLFRRFSSVCQSWFSLVLMPLIMFGVCLCLESLSIWFFPACGAQTIRTRIPDNTAHADCCQ